tara:strand:- start:7173 stop:7550 length:378 start_codon:yes stop_codon:yes gene_type:complete
MPNQNTYKYHTTGLTLTSSSASGSADVVYTCPTNYNGTVRFLHISNSSASARTVSVQLFIADVSAYKYITKTTSVAANAVLNLVNDNYFFMHAGDKIVAFSANPTDFEVMVSVEEEPAQFTFTGV